MCPPEYNPDQDCAIQFDLSVDILEPNLLSFELKFQEGINSTGEMYLMIRGLRQNCQQDFRLTISDIPTAPGICSFTCLGGI